MLNELKTLQTKYAINLFSWFNFLSKETDEEKDSKILVFGDANLDFVNTLSDRVSKVFIICETKEGKKILNNKLLHKNVFIAEEIIKDSFNNKKEKNDEESDETKISANNVCFDYVIVPKLFEAIGTYIGKSIEDIASYLTDTYTKKDGTIIFAFDNSLSLDAIAGKKVEAESLSFSYDEVCTAKENLEKKYVNSKFELFFPLPEYKFPLRIYSEEYLPFLDDEDKKTRNLVKLGLYIKYANSYIIVFDANTKKTEKLLPKRDKDDYSKFKILYTKFNASRNEKFALKTSIVENENKEKFVIKKSLYEDANPHVEGMIERSKLIKNNNIKMLMPIKFVSGKDTSDNKSYAIYSFLKGDMISNIALKRIANGEDYEKVLNEYMNLLIGSKEKEIETYNLDCLLTNAIKVNDDIFVIDGEWIDTNTTEVKFLKYRILKYFYDAYVQDLNFDSLASFVKAFNIDENDIERFEAAERDFQENVHKASSNSDVNAYRENSADLSRVYYVSSELDRAREKLKRIEEDRESSDIRIMKLYETLRLTEAHANNLQNVVNIHERDIASLQAQLAYFEKHEGFVNRIIRKIKEAFAKAFPRESRRRKYLKYFKNCFTHPGKMIKIFFTKDGRNIIEGDINIGTIYFDYGKLKFPYATKPKVSIIIPCYNQVVFTYKCLVSILETVDFNKYPYEIILADDVSTDATKDFYKYSENVVLSRNEENLGFLRNCNKAALLARGEYILFLNNDTEVKTNWLSSLVDLIESNGSFGMVGSKFIYPNGTLQEAGGIIWSDGSAWNYGRGDDPNEPQYNYVREADYISGASIMIRKSLWDEIGGFDERYVPAYCEDSDLAFEVRQKGYKVMYQPFSEVIHYEGISNGTDVNGEGTKKYQVINNEKLVDKWKMQLYQQYPVKANQNAFKARDRGQNKKVVLFIDHYIPTWDKDAGSKTTFQYIKMFLNKGYTVKFLGDNFQNSEPYGKILQQMGVEVLYGSKLEAEIWSYLLNNAKYIDFVYLNRPHIATKYVDFFKENTNIKVIFYGHDLHFLREEREYELTKNENSLQESKYYKSLELSVMYKTSMNYYPSSAEVKAIKAIDEKIPVKAIKGYIYDKIEETPMDFSKKRHILFVGGFAHPPNKDGLLWFKKSIFQRIKVSIPDIELDVVGSHSEMVEDAIKDTQGINLLGFVSDEELNNLYKNCKMVVAPLRYGAGVKGKIIEAFANGVPVVTTECGAEGIDNARTIMSVAKNAGDFADKVVDLYNDEKELANMSLKERQYINNNYSEDAAWKIIEDDFS